MKDMFITQTFQKEKTFTYFKPIEGWGLTNDGKNLYQDGTEKSGLWIQQPKRSRLFERLLF
jgi:glutamine cyclotransferase